MLNGTFFRVEFSNVLYLFPRWFLLARALQGGVEREELCDEGGERSSIQSDSKQIQRYEQKDIHLLQVTIFSPVLGSTIETCGHSVIG